MFMAKYDYDQTPDSDCDVCDGTGYCRATKFEIAKYIANIKRYNEN